MTLQEALTFFLQVDRSPATTETYRQFLSRFVIAIGPERPIELVRIEDIEAYIASMRARKEKYRDHPSRPVVTQPLAPTTVYRNVKMLKTFFNWAERRDYIAQSPARLIVNRRPGRPLGQGKAATDEEVDLMLLACRFDPRTRAMLMLLIHSGCRAGELARLKVDDLNLDECTAYVEGKGGMRRRIYYDEETKQAVITWLGKRPPVGHNYLFCAAYDGMPLSSPAVSQTVRRLSKRVGIRSLGAHSLRHRVGLKFARERVAPRVTQHYLGHADIKITLSYYQDVDDSDLREAGSIL